MPKLTVILRFLLVKEIELEWIPYRQLKIVQLSSVTYTLGLDGSIDEGTRKSSSKNEFSDLESVFRSLAYNNSLAMA